MKYFSRFAVMPILGGMLLLSGCTTGDMKYLFSSNRTELDPPTSPNSVLVIGYIEMDDKDSRLGVDIDRLKPAPDTFANKFWVKKHGDHGIVFFSEVLTTGQYQITRFHRESGTWDINYDVHEDPGFIRTFSKPGIYNVGAYKLRIIPPPNMVGRMKFAIEPAKGPGERAILATVQPYAKHEYWKTMIERRLRELPK